MLKSLLLFFALSFISLISAQNNHKIYGTISDKETQELLPFCKVILKQNDEFIIGTFSDIDGKFVFSNIEQGIYQLEVSYLGYETITKEVKVKNNDLSIDLGLIILESQTVILKPIIYLYPEEKTDVSVKLDYKGELLYSYPKYPDTGWNYTATPDGTLTSENGMEYYGLFWEGVPHQQLNIGEKGFVVKGNETVQFLETALDSLGLNRREAMEFIIFWQPRMQDNPYNLIHFSTEEYEELAKLEVSPQPATIIRVMMVFQPLAQPIDIEPQNLAEMHKERTGFTLVEWGGTILSNSTAEE